MRLCQKQKKDDKGSDSTERPKNWSREDEQKYREYRKDKGRGQGLSPAQWKQRQRPSGGLGTYGPGKRPGDRPRARQAELEEVPF
jgi:hypothetical protein